MNAHPYYTIAEVSEMLGLPRYLVRLLCRQGRISPASRVANIWMIDPGFTILVPPGYVAPKQGEERSPGRPKGAKNRNPYPKGVKRPLKKPPEEDKRRKENKQDKGA